MCLARRYVNCRACGGLYHRSIFVHVRSKAQVQPCTDGLICDSAAHRICVRGDCAFRGGPPYVLL